MNNLLLRTFVFATVYTIVLSKVRPLLIDIYNGNRLNFLHSYLSYLPSKSISLHTFIADSMQLLVGILALYMTLIGLTLLFLFGMNNVEKESTKKDTRTALILLIINGMVIRLFLAYFCYGNYDMSSYELVADIAQRGANVYVETARYNYTPVWLNILLLLKYIQLKIPSVEFHFIVRCFLSLIDLATLGFILLIAKINNVNMVKATLFFFLNPISFLITGYHGQFENMAILLIFAGVFCYQRFNSRGHWGKFFYWAFSTFGLLVKHNVFYQLIICLNYCFRRISIRVALFVVSMLVFLCSFGAYWHEGWQGIVNNVLLYASREGIYGITSLFSFPGLQYIFILGLCVFPLYVRREDLIKQILLALLFFVTFTTGMADQYLVLPLAFGSLRPSKGFFYYSLVGSLFILGSSDNLAFPMRDWLAWNIVWVAAAYWFATEVIDVSIKKKKLVMEKI